jgi:histidyl-tRNA synthetase
MTSKKKTSTPVKAKAQASKKAAAPAPVADKPIKLKVDRRHKVQLLQGFKDILPDEQRYWMRIRDVAENFAGAYGFSRIDLPVLEDAALFQRTSGMGSDIVQKEMYVFQAPGGDDVIALRPEPTASMVRAYMEHGMQQQPQPIKWFTMGPMFRHDRPQAGRLRQFHQVGFEVIGAEHPIADAEVMLLTYNFFKELGLQVILQVNSIGVPESRTKYIKVLSDYFKSRKADLSEQDRERLQHNVLRILDSKDAESQVAIAEAPQILDYLDEQSKADFMKVLEYLDEAGVAYSLNPRLVRGLDYYSKTTFEVWLAAEEGGRTSALGGGGRYDGLATALGSPQPVPAIGVGLGVERIIIAMKEAGIIPEDPYKPEVYLTQLGEQARKKALHLIEVLRKSGVRVSEGFSKNGLRPQLEQAGKLGVWFALILGQKEILDETIIVRDMENGVQEIVAQDKVVEEIKKRVDQRKKEVVTAGLRRAEDLAKEVVSKEGGADVDEAV